MKKIVIIGAGGFAREVLDVFDACNEKSLEYDVLGYIVQSKYGKPGQMVNDKPILGDFDWLETHIKEVYTICAVGAPHQRYRLVTLAQQLGTKFCSVVHPSAILTRWVTVGDGVVITAGCNFTNQIHIGNHAHINLDCTIGHDVVVKDFVTLSPGVHVSGNVTLEEGSSVGTGANIIEKLSIGAWSMIGAGSTIVKDVPENTTAVGVPGKVIKVRKAGWHTREDF